MTTWMLCEGAGHEALRPLTWLRPPSGLRFGAETLEDRWRRLVSPDEVVVVGRDVLAPLGRARIGWSELGRIGDETKGPAASIANADDLLWVDDRFVPDPAAIGSLRALPSGSAGLHRGRSVARRTVRIPHAPGLDAGPAAFSAFLQEVPEARELAGGDRIDGLGDLVRLQAACLEPDLLRLVEEHGPASGVGDGFAYARERIHVAADARIDHGAVLDAREGPIFLGAGTVVLPGAHLRGPLHAASGCLFLGGSVGSGSSFGPVTRVRGEVETTVFLGWSNKAHDGFVGHSYVGEWVNLGALTTTSDLKNDYGEVSLEIEGRRVPTGSNKIGTFFGDHVKTRIGCLLNTGTVLGLGCNVFGEPAVPDRSLEDFLWGTGPEAVEYRLEKFLRVARTVLGRRGVAWSSAYEAALAAAFEGSAPARARRGARA